MDLNGGAKSTDPLTNLLNKIRSYSPSNPNACSYDIAGDSAKWADDILKDTLKRLKMLGL